jgi:hypothetical protein
MAFINKLNQAFKVLIGNDGRTTQTGVDPEYLDSSLADIITIDNSRSKKYKDYIWMDDNYGQEISSTLDAVADMVLRTDEPLDSVVKVMSDSATTSSFIKDLYYYLDVRKNLWSWARSLSKFGDMFVEIIWYTNNKNKKLSGIAGLKVLPAKTIFLNVKDGIVNRKFPYRQEIDGNKVAEFRPWQIAHFMLPREPTDDYGTSWLKPARLPYRQLLAMENALVVARLKKPNMRVHRVDISGKTGDQAKEAIKAYKDQFLKKLWINPTTGKFEKHQTPVMSNDDIYMGVTKDGGKFAGIDLIEGKSEIDITDLLYIREKMLAALKTPKHRMNINDVGVSNKLVSVDQGLHFSASIQRVQFALITGLSFITDLALIIKGVDVNSRKNDYTLALPKQRTTDELIAARVELIKSTVAKNYKEMELLSDDEIMRSVLKLEPDHVERVKKELEKQRAQAVDNDQDGDNGNGNDNGKGNDKGNGNGKDQGDKNKNFNKTGTGSAPVRKPQKESLKKIFEDEDIKILVSDVTELMRNERIFGNKSFEDIDYIKRELARNKK